MPIFVLISCVKKKQTQKAKARDLYISTWFKTAYKYALSLRPEGIFILSAMHGLLDPEQEIEPYEKTLIRMPDLEVRAWAEKVLEGLAKRANLSSDHFVVLASQRYRKYLLPSLKSAETPMEGLGIGKQLQWLKKQVNP
jgi:cytoplasmic iron level regulating protein YaaA (DUF328/UPF0246 family)